MASDKWSGVMNIRNVYALLRCVNHIKAFKKNQIAKYFYVNKAEAVYNEKVYNSYSLYLQITSRHAENGDSSFNISIHKLKPRF